MAALNRPTNATYEIHENVTVDTQDNEDHTFCGIMFPVKCKDLLPIDHLVVKSVAVRGDLGPITVWVNKPNVKMSGENRYGRNVEGDDVHRVPLHPRAWIKVYEKTHKPCPRGQYTELLFENPIRLQPGEMRAFYIHSTLPTDSAIVYDNSYYGSNRRFDDDKLTIMTGRAHVSIVCFGQEPIWGWGNAWRDRREFVGTLSYGTVYKLWNPEVQPKFGANFQNGARTLAMCQRRYESPFSMLPDEAIYYILNMCRWDWFDDCTKTMKDRRKSEKSRTSSRMVVDDSIAPTQGKTTGLSEDSSDEDDDEDSDSEMDEMSDDSSEDHDSYHTADRKIFSFQYDDSDDSDNETPQPANTRSLRTVWLRRQFHRVDVLRALAAMQDSNES